MATINGRSASGAVGTVAIIDGFTGRPAWSGRPYRTLVSSGSTEIWGGPCRLRRVIIGGNSTGAAITLTLRDTTGGHPTAGGRELGTFIVPANGGALPPIEFDEVCANGLVATLSGAGVVVGVEIEAVDPSAEIFGQSDGAFIYRGDLTPAATTRVDTAALNADADYIRSGASSLRVQSANPAGAAVIEFNQGTQAGVAAVAATDLFRNAVIQVYVASPCQKYNNGTKGPNGSMTMQLRLLDSGYANGFYSAEYHLSPGWNRIVIPRVDFSSGVGSPSWASTTFSRIELRFDAGTSTNPGIDLYLDSIAINTSHSGAIPVMVDFDDGWDFHGGLADALGRYPALKINQFLTKDFSVEQLDKYGTLDEWRSLAKRYPGRIHLGWHSVSHDGPTALEALTQSAFAAAEIDPWRDWFGFTSGVHGVTPNGQDSAAMRAAFTAAGFASNRTIRNGHNHPWNMAQQGLMDLRCMAVDGAGTFPTDWNTQITRIGQTGCMPVFLFHSVSMEDAAPLSGSVAGLNILPTEFDHMARTLQGLADAGLVRMLTRDEFIAEWTVPVQPNRE